MREFIGKTGYRLNRQGLSYHIALNYLTSYKSSFAMALDFGIPEKRVHSALSHAAGILGLFDLVEYEGLNGYTIFNSMLTNSERDFCRKQLELIIALKGKKLYTRDQLPK